MAGVKGVAGRRKETTIATRVAEAVEGVLGAEVPDVGSAPPSRQPPALEDTGLVQRICEMRFAGLPSTRIALRLGISHDAVSKRVKSQRFLAVYEQFREKLEARVDEAVRLRVSDAVLAAVDDLLEMRDKARGWLRRQLNLDIMGLHEKYARVGAGGPSDLLRAIHEKTVRRGAGGSTTETERMIYEGGRGVVEAVTGVAEEVQPPPPREEAAVDAEWEEAAAAGSRGSDGNDPPASG